MVKFICIEGISYTGKTTLFENLGRQGFYKANRIALGYDKDYRAIKKDNNFKTKFDFFKEELKSRSNDYLKIDESFIADRYFLSIIAHYSIYLKQDVISTDLDFFNSLIQPDLTLLLTANMDTIIKRDKKRFENNFELLNEIQDRFLRVASNFSNIQIIKTDELSIEEVFLKAMKIISNSTQILNEPIL